MPRAEQVDRKFRYDLCGRVKIDRKFRYAFCGRVEAG